MNFIKKILILFLFLNSRLIFAQSADTLYNNELNNEKHTYKKENIYELYNKPLPPFELKLLNEEILSSESLKGKPTVINFWFTSCPPCIDELPFLNELKNKFEEEVNFIAITFENEKRVTAFLKKHDFDFIQVIEAREYIKEEIGIKTFPKTIILDKNLNISHITESLPAKEYHKENKWNEFGKRISDILYKLIKS